jgi:hypothetical protein
LLRLGKRLSLATDSIDTKAPMAADPRFCANCRAELPARASACDVCGVFAGELYDERMHRPRTRVAVLGLLLLLALAAGAGVIWWKERGGQLPDFTTFTAGPKVVKKAETGKRAPGGRMTEGEALRLVRRHLVDTTGIRDECLVLLGRGFRKGGYHVTARDHCTSTRLGHWRVDVKTGKVTRPRIATKL